MAQGTIELFLGTGRHPFCVGRHKQLFELQDLCGLKAEGLDGERFVIPSGPKEIFVRLKTGAWRLNDYRETIRLGLVGGGMKPSDALDLVERYVDDEPAEMSVALAAAVLAAFLVGVPGDGVGKTPAERTQSEAGASVLSAPPPTAPAPPSASAPATSTT